MERTVEDVQAALDAFDGRHVAPLKDCVAEPLDGNALETLIGAVTGSDQVGASWMLKAMAETGRLEPDAMAQVLESLPELTEPDAILHVLQMVQHAPASLAKTLRPALAPLHRHPRGLVRVWAFDAYCRGAETGAEREDVRERIRAGLTDRFAAMRARSRALAKLYGVEV